MDQYSHGSYEQLRFEVVQLWRAGGDECALAGCVPFVTAPPMWVEEQRLQLWEVLVEDEEGFCRPTSRESFRITRPR